MEETLTPSQIINTEVLNWMRLSKDERTGNPQDTAIAEDDVIVEKVSARIGQILNLRDKREEKKQK